jgi:hypothetical protein
MERAVERTLGLLLDAVGGGIALVGIAYLIYVVSEVVAR